MNASNTNVYKIDAILAIAGTAIIFLFILLTNPQNLSALFLLFLPLLIAFTSYRITKLLIEIFSDWSMKRVKQVSAVLATGITLIVLLSSLHQLGLQDFILSVSLVAGFGWYLRRLQPTLETE